MTEMTVSERLERLAGAGWSDVSDRILAGLCHDLNGRVTSLAGMVQLLQLDEDSSSMAPFLDEEVQRLERSVRLVRSLAGEILEEPEPIHLPEILPELRLLAAKHRHLESIETTLRVADDLMPIRGRWSLTGRAILILCSIAGHASLSRDRRVLLEAAVQGEHLSLTARVPGERSDEVELPPPAGRREGMAGVAELIGGGWFEREFPDAIEFGLELPLLSR